MTNQLPLDARMATSAFPLRCDRLTFRPSYKDGRHPLPEALMTHRNERRGLSKLSLRKRCNASYFRIESGDPCLKDTGQEIYMQIKESELALLDAIYGRRTVSGPDVVEELNHLLSKPHVYVLLSGLEQSGLIRGSYEATGRRGPPQRRYELTPAGRNVRAAAGKLVAELSAAGRHPEVIYQPRRLRPT